jgi:hypothetical protein
MVDVGSAAISTGKYITMTFYGLRAVFLGAMEGLMDFGNLLIDLPLRTAKAYAAISFGPMKTQLDAAVESLEGVKNVTEAVQQSFKDQKAEALDSMKTTGASFDSANEKLGTLRGELVNLSNQQVSSDAIAKEFNKSTKGTADELNGASKAAKALSPDIERLTASYHKQIEAHQQLKQKIDAVAATPDWFRLEKVKDFGLITVKTTADVAEAQKKTLEWAQANGAVLAPSLHNTGNVLDQVDEKVSHFSKSLKDVGATIVGTLQGGGDVFKAVGGSLGKALGEDVGEKLATGIGGKLGSTIGGFMGPIGAMAGSLLGSAMSKGFSAIKGLFTDKAAEDIKKYQVEIDKVHASLLKQYGSMENLEAQANRVGISMEDAWGHKGKAGLEATNELIAEMEGRLKAVDKASAQVVKGTQAVFTYMTKPWLDLGKAIDVAAKKTQDADDAFRKAAADGSGNLQQLQQAFYDASNEEQALYHRQWDMMEQSQGKLKDLGVQAMATFAAARLAGASWTEALEQTAPAIAMLADSYKALGIDTDDAGLKVLMMQSQILEHNPELVAAVDGLGSSMQGLAQLGLLNVDTFGSMQRTGVEMYTRLQGEVAALGGTTTDALLPMQGYLHEAEAQAKLLGIPLDENTQMLIDQSKELGIWKQAGESANDKLINGMTLLNTTMTNLITTINGISGGLNAIPRTVTSDVFVTTYYSSVDNGGGEGEASRAAGSPGTAFENWRGGTPVTLHGRESVVSQAQGNTLAGMVGDAINNAQTQAPAANNEETNSLLRALAAEVRRGNETFATEIRDAIQQMA